LSSALSIILDFFKVLPSVFYGRNINYDYNYYLHSNKLDKVDRMKDLGVTFDLN